MAELSESRMNVAALKRADPYVKDLLETATHVALYSFNADDNGWEKTDVEGALFVYSRTGEPFHNILIMNRLNTKNFVEPVVQGLDLHLEDPYLLYRTVKGSIFCIWFYDKEECSRIGTALGKLVKETCQEKDKLRKKNLGGGDVIGASTGVGVDIFSMLSKAQEEYNSGHKTKNDDGGKKEADNTPKSVKDFFMKASWGTQFKNGPKPGGMMGLVGSQRPMPPPGLDPVPGRSNPGLNIRPKPLPLLEKIMLDPQNSVQHIEKQQRSVTPQSELAALIRSSQEQLQKKPEKEKKPNLSSSSSTSLQNGLGFLRISDNTTSPTSTVQTLNFFNSNLGKNLEPRLSDDTLPPSSILPPSNPKPTLMPPMMFTSSSSSLLRSSDPVKDNKPLQTSGSGAKPEPLTKNQLLQAVEYLLKNDPEFIQKIHEAYVKSFSELVS